MKKKAKTYNYSYKERRVPIRGLVSLLLGLASLGIGSGLVWRVISGREAADWVGALGFTAFCGAVSGVALGLGSFRENCRSYFLGKFGTIFCALMAAAWFLIFCWGKAA